MMIKYTVLWEDMHFVQLSATLCTSQYRVLTTLEQRANENIVGKEENAGNQHFLLFPQSFSSYQRLTSIF